MARRVLVVAAGLLLVGACAADDVAVPPSRDETTVVTDPPAETSAPETTAPDTSGVETTAPASDTTVPPSDTSEAATTDVAPSVPDGAQTYDSAWEVGACFDAPEGDDYSRRVPVGDCAMPHDFEIFGTATYRSDTTGPFPGRDVLTGYSEQVCGEAYEQFTGFSSDVAPIAAVTFTPDESDWASGNNNVWCTARDPDGKMTGTVASAGLEAPNMRLLHVAIGTEQVDLFVSMQDGDPVQVTADPEEELTFPPSISSTDPGLVFYSRYPQGETSQADIVSFDITTGTITPILATPADEVAPRLSPDGTKIAFASNAAGEGEFDIWIMSSDGSQPARLTPNPLRDAQPSWSPDGSTIVYRASDGDASNVWVMNADGSNPRQLTDSGGDFDPVYSPDGSQIAFSSRRDGNFDIWVMNADGSDPLNVTNHPANDDYPMWFANGNRIAFTSNRYSTREWVMNADGSRQTMFTTFGPSGYGTPFTIAGG